MNAVPSAVAGELLRTLRDLLGDRVTAAPAVREHHSRGESYHTPAAPDLVAYPRTTEEISAIVRAAAAHDVPIVAFGAGTSLEGQVLALKGGVCIDLTQMNQVLRVSVEDLDATVQAGVTHRQLNKHLANTGLTFFVDPGADATLGGMTATGASGTTAVRYGTMRENVQGLDRRAGRRPSDQDRRPRAQVLGRLRPDAAVRRLRGHARHHQRDHRAAASVARGRRRAVCSFPSIDAAVKTVIATIQLGVPVARIELLDEVQMDAINRFSKLDYPGRCRRSSSSSTGQTNGRSAIRPRPFRRSRPRTRAPASRGSRGRKIGRVCGGRGTTPYYASLALRPGAKAWTTDACVPISRLADCIVESKRDLDESSLTGTLVGHVGDGNFHMLYLVDPDRPEEMAEAASPERAAGRPRARHGRHVHGRARRGRRQDALPRARTRRGARHHARHQAGARPSRD